ncbi:ATP12 family protein [Novosphingobium sp. PS1R-30]|uniref:ATP12 family protein n=1 Tax=Novosphingobium anseongense TaxID=3133436 RepID=A0ABU8RQA0_9SPHN
MKRFYKQVSVGQNEEGWRVLLDGRGLKTVSGRAQVLPTQALAEALAEEWADQGDEIDPASFVLRDMADYAIDVVGQDRSDAIRSLVAYAGTDTLCYRAEPDEPLHERQLEVWEPLLHAAEQRWDVHFERIDGIMHRPQPAATLTRMEAVLAAESDHVLAAVNTLTNLASSLVIALAALAPEADAEALWDVANLEEDWQASLWGKDAEAEERRAQRLAVFETAMRYARLARN